MLWFVYRHARNLWKKDTCNESLIKMRLISNFFPVGRGRVRVWPFEIVDFFQIGQNFENIEQPQIFAEKYVERTRMGLYLTETWPFLNGYSQEWPYFLPSSLLTPARGEDERQIQVCQILLEPPLSRQQFWNLYFCSFEFAIAGLRFQTRSFRNVLKQILSSISNI